MKLWAKAALCIVMTNQLYGATEKWISKKDCPHIVKVLGAQPVDAHIKISVDADIITHPDKATKRSCLAAGMVTLVLWCRFIPYYGERDTLGSALIRGQMVWKQALFVGFIMSQIYGANPEVEQLVASEGSINGHYGTNVIVPRQRETLFKAACEGQVKCCPCVSKFTAWVMCIGGGALALTAYLCLQKLQHCCNNDDDPGIDDLNLLFKKDT